MQFTIRPVLDQMETIYRMPRSPKRFEAYLLLLQGQTKKDMILPIAGYNPMGKPHVLDKLMELQKMRAETIIDETLQVINRQLPSDDGRTIEVVVNLADDVGGAWTNLYTTDYSSKFDLNAFVTRNFCTPYFWTSEIYTKELIVSRAKEYAYRTLYWIEKGRIKSLEACLAQEVFVQQHIGVKAEEVERKDYSSIEQFLSQQSNSEDYNHIFNFFYGDEASLALGYPTFGRAPMEGFDYARYQANRKS